METVWIVEYADFYPSDQDHEVVRPSTQMDERTKRVRAFPNEEKAMEYAQKHYDYLKDAKYDGELNGLDWLHHMKVYKCQKELIKDFK